jgi:hypothetical protein
MKRIKLTAERFGPGYFQEAGLVIELPDKEADVEIERGRAEEYVETTAVEPGENAAAGAPREKAINKRPREKRG